MSDIRAQGKKPGAELPPERLSQYDSFHILSNVPLQPFVEGVLKGNIDFFILFLLEGNEKSGKQVIEEMARMFSCPVSQATLYQQLERLEKTEKLIKRVGKGREKLYSLAPDVAGEFRLRKKYFLEAVKYVEARILASCCSSRPDGTQMKLSHFSLGKPK